MEYKKELQVASGIAKEAGFLLKELSKKDFKVEHKGVVDLVTEGDFAAEELIISKLTDAFDYKVLSEEAHPDEKSAGYLWVIDPLDGTTNYAHNLPVYAVSIGLVYEGQPVAGVVYEPNQDEMFTAIKGAGAYLNDKKIKVSATDDLNSSLLSTGFPYDIRQNPRATLKPFNTFVLNVQGVRRTGAASIDICYTACGRFDGFWELGLKPWDTAAASLILEEAGGKLSKYDGSSYDIWTPEMVASNGLIHKRMLEVLNGS